MPELADFLIPIGSGVVGSGRDCDNYLDRDRLARLRADLEALADHRGAAERELRNGGCRA